jgi:hypothetical protein
MYIVLTCSSMVLTDMAKEAIESLKLQGVDLTGATTSVEQSTKAMLQVVREASHCACAGADGRLRLTTQPWRTPTVNS